MNDFWKKNSFNNTLVVIVLGILLCWGTVGYGQSLFYKTKYRTVESELGHLRTELESANNKERELEEQVDTVRTITNECVEFVDREHEILITTGNTIQEIRAGFEELTAYCESLEMYIFGVRNNLCGTNNIYNTGD